MVSNVYNVPPIHIKIMAENTMFVPWIVLKDVIFLGGIVANKNDTGLYF
jgi:hypothetical protein